MYIANNLALKISSWYMKTELLPMILNVRLLFDYLQEVMAEHDSQYLIELDGNKPPEELFMVSAMLSKNMSQFGKSKKY